MFLSSHSFSLGPAFLHFSPFPPSSPFSPPFPSFCPVYNKLCQEFLNISAHQHHLKNFLNTENCWLVGLWRRWNTAFSVSSQAVLLLLGATLWEPPNLAGYSSQSCMESDMTETTQHTHEHTCTQNSNGEQWLIISILVALWKLWHATAPPTKFWFSWYSIGPC